MSTASGPDMKKVKVEDENFNEEIISIGEKVRETVAEDEKSTVIPVYEESLNGPDFDEENVKISTNYWPYGLDTADVENRTWLYFCKVEANLEKYEIAERIFERLNRKKHNDRIPWMVIPMEGYLLIYLNIESITEDPSILTEMRIQLLAEAYYHEAIIRPEEFEFADTFDYAEATISKAFKLKLRDYQLRSVTWMKSVEDIKETEHNTITVNENKRAKFELGDSSVIICSPMVIEKFYGGILADDTGSGKTITTLALIHSTNFTVKNQKDRQRRFPNCEKYYQSRASAVFCPANIYEQWLSEANRCSPNFKLVGISTFTEMKSYSLSDFMEADLVVVSYQLLLNPKCKNTNYLSKFHFHRVILDECHELEIVKNSSIKRHLAKIRADFHWGLTGTPHTDDLPDQLRTLKFNDRLVSFYLESSYFKREIEKKIMKRNVPDLELPKLEEEVVWVEMNLDEKALCESRGYNASTGDKIRLYTHYQLDEKENVPSDGFLPVEGVKGIFYERKKVEIEELTVALERENAEIYKELEADPEADVKQLLSKSEKIEEKLKNAQSSLNYFNAVFKAIKNPEENKCAICCEYIDDGNFTIIPCCHFYCYECLTLAMKVEKECPLCRRPVHDNELFRIKPGEISVPPNAKYSGYSSKLIAVYNYISELLKSDPSARIILFLQYKDLAKFAAVSFAELGINCARVTGSVLRRQKAINEFKNSNSSSVAILSSEDSVSGMNLTEATHILLMHPFWTNRGEEANLAYEKQGISRAHRFGLKRPLKVVRFAVNRTVEEEITLRRMNN